MGKGKIKKQVHKTCSLFLSNQIDDSSYKIKLKNILTEYPLWHVGTSLAFRCRSDSKNIRPYERIIKLSCDVEPKLKTYFDVVYHCNVLEIMRNYK